MLLCLPTLVRDKKKYYLVIRRYPLLLNTYNLVNNGTLRAPYTGLQFLK